MSENKSSKCLFCMSSLMSPLNTYTIMKKYFIFLKKRKEEEIILLAKSKWDSIQVSFAKHWRKLHFYLGINGDPGDNGREPNKIEIYEFAND